MDNVTHTLFGVTLGRAAFHRYGRGTTAALVLASNAPDADIVTAAGGTLNYLAWHRGPTHGPLGIVGLAAITAGLVWMWQRYTDRPPQQSRPASFAALFAAAVCGLIAHVLMDFPTSYGTRLFSPFDWHWYATDLMPIVDIYLLVVLAGSLVVGYRRPAFRRQAAAVAIAFTILNYAVRAGAHQWALAASAQVLDPVLPPPCRDAVPPSLLSRWPIPATAQPHPRGAGPAPGADQPCLVEIAAIPTFLSPMRWQVIARTTDAYQTMDLNLLAPRTTMRDAIDAPWRDAVRHPDQWTANVWRAADTDLARTFLGFSRFPVAQSELHTDRSATVSWIDLRFVNTPARRRGAGMFAATVRLAADGRVLATRLGE